MTNINIGKKELIHFVGIGGIGMSGLAQVMKTMGFNVQGSDISKNKNTDNCKKVGIKIFIGHKRKNILNTTIIVRSSAIKNNNIELIESRKRKMPIYERVEMLANIVALKKNIVITGSHGKTTTTSLVAKILSLSKLDPTIINGGVIKSINSNAKFGKGEWAVLEADESDGSFLKLPINYSVITNLDKEHFSNQTDLSVSIFFLIFPLLFLKIVVPETKIFAPASLTSFELSKFIPPSTSISKFRLLFFLIPYKVLIFFKISGINFWPPNPG